MSVCFSSSYLKNALAYESCDISGLTAEMLYKIMLDGLVENGSFSEEYTEREKENKCQALKAVINNKDAYASNRCLQLMCQGEAASFLYSIDTEPYEKLNGELLYKAYKNMINTSPVIITYVGEDEDFAERFAKRISDSIKSEQRLPLNAEKTVKFPEKIKSALDAYEPSIVTRYILDVAAAFNRFYHNCHILSVDDEGVKATRIMLTKATNIVLGNAFDLICMKKTKKI